MNKVRAWIINHLMTFMVVWVISLVAVYSIWGEKIARLASLSFLVFLGGLVVFDMIRNEWRR